MGSSIEINNKHLLLFDGVCNLCNGAVTFIIDRDRKQRIVFASLQSELGQKILKQHQLSEEDFKSMVLVREGKISLRSSAVLEITKKLSGAWPLLYAFIIVPKFLRDWIYGIISANRYKWFGRKDQCRIPSPDIENRFVSV